VKFSRTIRVESHIPTTSMADISFLLFIFFMSTTIFKMDEGLRVTLPRAEMGEKVPRERVTHVWIDAGGRVSVDDKLVEMKDLATILYEKVRQNPGLIVGFNTDQDAPYAYMADAIDAMKEAGVLPVSFATRRGEE
jgi:biopolymer transport protein ExbD